MSCFLSLVRTNFLNAAQELLWCADFHAMQINDGQAKGMNNTDSRQTQVESPSKNRYRFTQMAVGDSILIDDFRAAQSARVSAINFIKRHELAWKFGIRKTCEGWRILRLH
jgi:hypothetical protein